MKAPIPISGNAPRHIALPQAPLIRVIAQVRFPAILAIGDRLRVAAFQEQIRKIYPMLSEEIAPQLIIGGAGSVPNLQDRPVWRFSDREDQLSWRVSLGQDFIALETAAYESHADFLGRLELIVKSLEASFEPSVILRLGIRYIDRLTGDALQHLQELVAPKVLGLQYGDGGKGARIGAALKHTLTHAEIVAEEGQIQARWGAVPANGTYDPVNVAVINEPSWVLDLDMFKNEIGAFSTQHVMLTAHQFTERIYDVFREMVTEEFLRFYGGKP